MQRKGKSVWNSYSTEYSKADNCLLSAMRGTSGDLGHTRQSRYRCSLPGLAGFAGPRCTEPEVPRSGSPALRDCLQNCSTAIRSRDFGSTGKNYFAGLASRGTTSAGFTQFTLNGPMAFTWTIVAVLLNAKCRISFGMLTKLPGLIVSSFVASNFSPMPT